MEKPLAEQARSLVTKSRELIESTHWIAGSLFRWKGTDDGLKPTACAVGMLRWMSHAEQTGMSWADYAEKHLNVSDGIEPVYLGNEGSEAYLMALRSLACTAVLDPHYIRNGCSYAGKPELVALLEDTDSLEDIIIGWNDLGDEEDAFDEGRSRVLAGFKTAEEELANQLA